MALRSARTLAALAVLAAAALGVVAYRLNVGRRAVAELARVAEAAKLEAEGRAVAARANADELRARADALALELPGLRAELEQARKAAKGSRVVYVAHGTTGEVPVQGQGAAPEPAVPTTPPADRPGSAAPCLLTPEDRGEVRVGQVALETRAGNLVLVGVAEAWRAARAAAPAELLFAGPLRIEAEAAFAGGPRRPRWGGGLFVAAGREGAVGGPAVAFPQAELFGWSIEVVAGAGVGPSGAWQLGGAAIVRQGGGG